MFGHKWRISLRFRAWVFLVASSHRILQSCNLRIKLAVYFAQMCAAPSTTLALNRDDIKVTLEVLGVKVPTSQLNRVLTSLRDYIFSQPRVKAVRTIPGDPHRRLVLLRECISDPSLIQLPSDQRDVLTSLGIATATANTITVDYHALTADVVLSMVINISLRISLLCCVVNEMFICNRCCRRPWGPRPHRLSA